MELQGAGGAVDVKGAEEHFRAAADAGFPQGDYGLGEVLRLQNKLAEAGAPYERAAAAGIIEADFWLGCIASEGLGQARDEKTAAVHFLKAALGGHLVSQAIAADVMRHGAGMTPDPDGARHWDVEVEKFENADVIATIGSLYIEGRLVQRDPVKALHFLRKAAERGQAAAQRLAGTLLATGDAGERDLEEAYQWLWLASRSGQADAEPAFRAVLNSMSGEQIIQAAKRAESFHPRIG
jgi:TPR repeat protein